MQLKALISNIFDIKIFLLLSQFDMRNIKT